MQPISVEQSIDTVGNASNICSKSVLNNELILSDMQVTYAVGWIDFGFFWNFDRSTIVVAAYWTENRLCKRFLIFVQKWQRETPF